MIVTITQFASLAKDESGNSLPLGDERSSCQARTTAGAFTALDLGTSFVRIATDTPIRMDIEGGTTDTADELFPAGVEFISVDGGEVLSFIIA